MHWLIQPRNNIVFNDGQYDTDTDKGKRLLGHELTHVVQQNALTDNVQNTASAKLSRLTSLLSQQHPTGRL
jgi:hypothetical protein